MKFRWKGALLALLALALLGGTGRCYEVSDDLARAAPEAAELIDGEAGDFGLASGLETLWDKALDTVKKQLLSGARSVAMLMAGVVLLGLVESLASDKGGMVKTCTTAVGALWCTAVSAGDLESLMGLGRETIHSLAELGKLLIPALASATAAMGGVTSASVRQVAAVFFSNLLLTVIDRLLMPLVYLYIGMAAAQAIWEGSMQEQIGNLLKKVIVWSLSGILLLFTTFLTVSGAVAGSVDQQAARLAKAAVSTAVPVVGSILSEAAESVLAGAGILRGTLGAFGALAVLSLALAPVLRLGCQYLLYQGAGLVSAAAGPEKLAKLLRSLGDAFALVLAMTASSALLLIIALVSTLTAVTA